ncbi:hypothetical protein V5799_006153 [Amblyomma americanum]|uniref:PDZ domain-containing protein n=1 Tax=Amblyomma americanum TaxID=6943 RepID=A0AAQ4DX79_AMBAM
MEFLCTVYSLPYSSRSLPYLMCPDELSIDLCPPSAQRNSGSSVGSDQQQPRPASPPSQPPAASSGVSLPAGAPAARLCHLVRRPDFDGYGFNLHADKQRRLQYVGAVDPGSPAEAAGLRANDTIVEVNGVNVEGANHRDIVERIKAVPNETRLLVVDDGSAAWYKEHGIAIRGDLPNVIQLSSVKAAARRASKGQQQAVAATAETTSSSAPPPPPSETTQSDGLRLCRLSKWPNFDGYGFNLHADKKRQGHFIGQVDAGSPAELGGLRKNDRLVEVNGLSVEGESHREIIERIKQDPGHVDLLVIDRETDEAFTRRKQKPSSQCEGVVRRCTPPQQPGTEHKQQGTGDVVPEVQGLPDRGSSTAVGGTAGGKPPRRGQASRVAGATRTASDGSEEVSEDSLPEDAGTEAATPAPDGDKKDRSVVRDENSGTQPCQARGDKPGEAGSVPASRAAPSPARYAYGPGEYGQFWDASATADGGYLWPGDVPPWTAPFAPAYGGVFPPPPYNPLPHLPPAYAPCYPRGGGVWPSPFPYQAPPYAPFWPAAYSGYPLAYSCVDPVLPYPYAASAAPDLPQQDGSRSSGGRFEEEPGRDSRRRARPESSQE